MTRHKQIVLAALALLACLLWFEFTPTDLWLQQQFYDSATGHWLWDRDEPVLRFLLYDGIKKLFILFALGLLVALLFYRKSALVHNYRKGILVVLLSLFFLFHSRRNRIRGLWFRIASGWITGGYKMVIGDHFLSHTVHVAGLVADQPGRAGHATGMDGTGCGWEVVAWSCTIAHQQPASGLRGQPRCQRRGGQYRAEQLAAIDTECGMYRLPGQAGVLTDHPAHDGLKTGPADWQTPAGPTGSRPAGRRC